MRVPSTIAATPRLVPGVRCLNSSLGRPVLLPSCCCCRGCLPYACVQPRRARFCPLFVCSHPTTWALSAHELSVPRLGTSYRCPAQGVAAGGLHESQAAGHACSGSCRHCLLWRLAGGDQLRNTSAASEEVPKYSHRANGWHRTRVARLRQPSQGDMLLQVALSTLLICVARSVCLCLSRWTCFRCLSL